MTETVLSPREVMRAGLCIGCGACVGAHQDPHSQMAFDAYGQFKPTGSADFLDRRTSTVADVCPFSPSAKNEDVIAALRFPDAAYEDDRIGWFEAAYVGAVREDTYRDNGSSGGMVSWVATELLRLGLVDSVAHVQPSSGEQFFRYAISRTIEDVQRGAKSRYYPVELSGVLDEIRQVPGRYAIVGIPCFIKAVQLLRAQDRVFAERIAYTLGLFCGHMKSARMVESFAWQMDTVAQAVDKPQFRLKGPERPANWYTAQLQLKDGTTRQKDWWHLADGDWGAGFLQNSACNFCDDVVAETADISFGDAWVEPHSSDWRGTNVVVVRAPQLKTIIDGAVSEGRLDLQAVDGNYVAQTQAAGLRQRREGLAYRLSWRHHGLRPNKRVLARTDLPLRRKIIYRLRFGISQWSHRIFWLAQSGRTPAIYVVWARLSLRLYHGLAYGRGRTGAVARWLGLVGKDG